MTFDPIYNFKEIIQDTNNIRDLLQISLTYYVYFDLKITSDQLFIEDKQIHNFCKLIIQEKITNQEIQNLKVDYHPKLKEYINIILNLKRNFDDKYHIISEKNKIVHHTNSYIPIIKKNGGINDGYIAIRKITHQVKINNICSLFLFKKRLSTCKLQQEIYLTKIYQILTYPDNQYEIFLSINDDLNILLDENSYICVEILLNIKEFIQIPFNELISKKPQNLIKSLFIQGILGNRDVHDRNILTHNHLNTIEYFVVDPSLIFQYRDKNGFANNISLNIMNLFYKFIISFDVDLKKNLLDTLDKLFTTFLCMLRNHFYDLLLFVKVRSRKKYEIIFNRIKNFDLLLEKKFIFNVLNLMTQDEMWQELIDIKNNIDYEKIDTMINFISDNECDNFLIEDYNVSISTSEYYKIVIKNIKAFDLMMEKYV